MSRETRSFGTCNCICIYNKPWCICQALFTAYEEQNGNSLRDDMVTKEKVHWKRQSYNLDSWFWCGIYLTSPLRKQRCFFFKGTIVIGVYKVTPRARLPRRVESNLDPSVKSSVFNQLGHDNKRCLSWRERKRVWLIAFDKNVQIYAIK